MRPHGMTWWPHNFSKSWILVLALKLPQHIPAQWERRFFICLQSTLSQTYQQITAWYFYFLMATAVDGHYKHSSSSSKARYIHFPLHHTHPFGPSCMIVHWTLLSTNAWNTLQVSPPWPKWNSWYRLRQWNFLQCMAILHGPIVSNLHSNEWSSIATSAYKKTRMYPFDPNCWAWTEAIENLGQSLTIEWDKK